MARARRNPPPSDRFGPPRSRELDFRVESETALEDVRNARQMIFNILDDIRGLDAVFTDENHTFRYPGLSDDLKSIDRRLALAERKMMA